jgi:hypothetical protein
MSPAPLMLMQAMRNFLNRQHQNKPMRNAF